MNPALSMAIVAIPLFLTACGSARHITELKLNIGDPQADFGPNLYDRYSRLEIDGVQDAGSEVRMEWRAFVKDEPAPRSRCSVPIRSSSEVNADIGRLRLDAERFHLSSIPLTISQGTSLTTSIIEVEPGEYVLMAHWRAGKIAQECGDVPTKLAQFNLWRDPSDLDTSPDWRIELVMLVEPPAGEIK